MTGRKAPPALGGPAIAFLAILALGGAMGAGQAQVATDPAASPIQTPLAEAAAQFTPSEEAQFEEAFGHLEGNLAAPSMPDHAVDLTTIEPAEAPAAEDLGSGVASYYGRRFHGRPTASGEAFDMNAMTAAHKTLPFGSRVRVTNPRNGRTVVVRVNDRGPYVRGREIDVSRAAAEELGLIAAGHATVELELLEG